jgi:hypothetical protein
MNTKPWVAWFLPLDTAHWRKVGETTTESEAWRLVQRVQPSGVICVLKQGQHPARRFALSTSEHIPRSCT